MDNKAIAFISLIIHRKIKTHSGIYKLEFNNKDGIIFKYDMSTKFLNPKEGVGLKGLIHSLLIFNFCFAKRSRSSSEDEFMSALISSSKTANILSTTLDAK